MKTMKRFLVLALVATLSFFVFLPPGQNESNKSLLGVKNNDAVICSAAATGEEVKISSRLLELLFGKEKNGSSDGKVLLIAGGSVFGAKIKQNYISISDPGDCSELKVGDKIISANGTQVYTGVDLAKIVRDSGGKDIELVCKRGDKTLSVKITPKSADGEYKLGMILKDGAAGLGTITYIDPETGLFGGLGHGICDIDTGELIDMTGGEVTNVIIGGVKKGESGKPGEISGILTDKINGTLYANTECGIFGKLDKIPKELDTVAIEIGHKNEVHTGEATIISTVKMGMRKEYSINITEINQASDGTKSFKIKVTDPTLIAMTGGVVRGMSGSPIIQDGKLVGAVTHVLVANPTEGYGIFIENMLNAAQSQAQQKAA